MNVSMNGNRHGSVTRRKQSETSQRPEPRSLVTSQTVIFGTKNGLLREKIPMTLVVTIMSQSQDRSTEEVVMRTRRGWEQEWRRDHGENPPNRPRM